MLAPWDESYDQPRECIKKQRHYFANKGLPSQSYGFFQWSCMDVLLAAAAKSLQSCPTLRPHRQQLTRLPHPWDSPGKNTGVGCHFLLQCMNGKRESEVTQSCPTLSDPIDCSPPSSPIPGILQARTLEWVAILTVSYKKWKILTLLKQNLIIFKFMDHYFGVISRILRIV